MRWRWLLGLKPKARPGATRAAKSWGVRMYRSDTMDELPSPETPFRDDSLRELVDALPPLERHVIERCFFGGEPFSLVAKELNVDVKVAKAARAKALETLKEALQHDKPLRALRAATKRRV